MPRDMFPRPAQQVNTATVTQAQTVEPQRRDQRALDGLEIPEFYFCVEGVH